MNLIKSASDTNILVVDDNPDNLRLLSRILESQNYIVLKSLSGKMALQAAQRNPPDLMLLDVNMPDLSGYDVCQKLKASEITAHIPIIFISGLDQITDKVQAFAIGGQDYISKPFQELEILARVKNQLLIQQQKRFLAEQNHQLQQEVQSRHQAEAEVRRLNTNLERQVQIRTLKLQQALTAEVALKRISDQVRDSLDQHQILRTAIETLAQTLEAGGCAAAMYSADQTTSTIYYQWLRQKINIAQIQTRFMADLPELYEQLHNRLSFALCPLQTDSSHTSAIFACSIFDDQVNRTGVLGDLWVFRDSYSSFSEIETNLIQQVANQCAIALRQARLYEAAQAQVKELERLNQLKDDFLSTISHELRTPIANMKMVIALLTTLTDQGRSLITQPESSPAQDEKVVQYFQVLQEECDRELALVEDLLNLQHIEAGAYSSQPVMVQLQDLLPHLMEPFELQANNQQQVLQINIDPALPCLNLDTFSFSRVVTELLSNACKYAPVGATISVSASMIPDTIRPDGLSYLHLTVTNTGIELTPEELPRIFDKFYRIPQQDPWKYGGTGLGLTLVKKLVEQMGGTIEAESGHNQTCFRVRLAVARS